MTEGYTGAASKASATSPIANVSLRQELLGKMARSPQHEPRHAPVVFAQAKHTYIATLLPTIYSAINKHATTAQGHSASLVPVPHAHVCPVASLPGVPVAAKVHTSGVRRHASGLALSIQGDDY